MERRGTVANYSDALYGMDALRHTFNNFRMHCIINVWNDWILIQIRDMLTAGTYALQMRHCCKDSPKEVLQITRNWKRALQFICYAEAGHQCYVST